MTTRKNPTEPYTARLPFNARLFPYRSLSPSGFAILMGVVTAICLGIGTLFYTAGAWPVIGFMGLDILLIYGAFKLNYHAARAYEEVTVSRQELLVRKVSPKGRANEHRFNLFGTRFVVDRHDEIGITEMRLQARERAVGIGSFLNPLDKESFASAFGAALATAKR